MELLAWLPVCLSTLWIVLGLIGVIALTRHRVRRTEGLPPVSILKPLCGRDPALRENLASFFEQDHER
ncbi:MAG TPA: hypothetical protein VF103_18915, partial [Polyangiaceae bacterium]